MLIDILLVIIRDVEYLVLWPFFAFFHLKDMKENLPVSIDFLYIGGIENLFLQYLRQDLS